jgi:ABC-type multidrug transport system permease subunit
MREILTLIIKEFIEYFRDRTLILTYLLPIVTLFTMGYGMNLDTEHVRTIIIDRDKTPTSKKFEEKFYNTKYFRSKTLDISFKEALDLIKNNRADLLIIVPSNFEKDFIKGAVPHIGTYIDGTFPVMSKTIDGYVKSALQRFFEESTYTLQNVNIEVRYLFNQSMKTRWAVVPGCIALIILMVPAMFSALMIVKEKERGTIFNFYASDMTKFQFIAGKVIPAFLVNSVIIFILFILAIYPFNMPFKGSFTIYIISSILFIFVSIGIGLFISIITDSQVASIILTAIVTVIPGLLYSGITSPIDSMQGIAYYVAHAYPIMYYVKIMYDCFLVGDGFYSELNRIYMLVLILFIFIIYCVDYLLLKKRVV